TLEEAAKARKILRLFCCDSTYFPYRDFVRHIKLPAILLVPYKSQDEIKVEIWMNRLKSMDLHPLVLTSLRNLHSVEITKRPSRKCDLMAEANNLVGISALLEALPYLEKLTFFGFWLYEVP